MQQCLRRALGYVGSRVTTESEDPLTETNDSSPLPADSAKLSFSTALRKIQEYSRKPRIFLGRETELREVVLGVVRQHVYWLSKKVGVTAQPGRVALEVRHGGLDLLWEFAGREPLLQ